MPSRISVLASAMSISPVPLSPGVIISAEKRKQIRPMKPLQPTMLHGLLRLYVDSAKGAPGTPARLASHAIEETMIAVGISKLIISTISR